MPVAPQVSYPGVYIQEVESNVRTITPVATADTAFIGRARKGPLNKPVTCNSFADFERNFGALWEKSKLGYAVQDFFMNGGGAAIIVRVFRASGGQDGTDGEPPAAAVTLGTNDVSLIAVSPGTWAKNFQIEVQRDPDITVRKDQAKKLALSETQPISEDEVFTVLVKEGEDVLESFPRVTFVPSRRQIDGVLAKESQLVRVKQNKVSATKTFALPAAKAADAVAVPTTETATVTNSLAQAKQAAEDKLKTLEAAETSTAGKLETARAELQTAQEAFEAAMKDTSKDAAANLATVTDKLREKKAALETAENKADAASAAAQDARRAAQMVRRAVETGEQVKGSLTAPGGAVKVEPNKYAFKDDDSADTIDDGDDVTPTELLGNEDKTTGMYALATVPFNLLVFPEGLYKDNGQPDDALLGPAIKYCKDRRAMLLLDTPPSWDKKALPAEVVTNFKAELAAKVASYPENAVFYYPRILKSNSLKDGQVEEFSPLGAIAGVIAKTDATRGVWKAPAGLAAGVGGITGLTVDLTDAQNGQLNPFGVNCLRRMTPGIVVWGARTVAGDDRLGSQWKYLPVRRTALFIEESLFQGTQWAVFEPNDEPLWASLRLNIGVFMHSLFRQGAFQGQSPAEAYFVRCDKTTTTQADIDRGIVNIWVGFAPLKPAEFVVLYIQQIAGQLTA